MRLFVAAVLVAAAQAASLGSDKCTWGPSYWCSSIHTASTCQAFTHCLHTVWKHQLLDVQQTETCLFSQKLVETIRRVLTFKDGKDQATHLVASMCTFIKEDDMRKECKNTVTNYFPQIPKLVESGAETSSVAAVLGFCKPYDDSVNNTPKQGPYYPPTNQTMCNDCRAFVADLQTLINQPNSENQFESVMENIVCSELGDLEVLCKFIMEVELPKLYKFVAENDHPEMVCRLGTFCIDTVDAKPKESDMADVIKKGVGDVIGSFELDSDIRITCTKCDKVLSSVLAFEKESRFRNSVEKAIGYLCSRTSIGEEKCQLLAEGFIPKDLAEMVSSSLNVRDVCTSTLACDGPWPQSEVVPKSPAAVSRPSVRGPKPTDFCSDCQRFFADVRDVLRNNVSAPEAAALAKQTVCQQAGSLEFQCNDLMDVAMPTILEWLARVDTPATVCADLTMCPKPNTTPKFDLMKAFGEALDKKPLTDTFKCDECEALVQDLRNADRSPEVQNAVVGFFNEVCDKLGQEAQQCKALVQQYAPQLFELVASELEPSVLCELLLKCTKPGYSVQEKEDEALPQTVPETVVISSPRSVVKKSKKNSAVYAKQKKVKEEGKKMKKVGASVECAICRLAMESIDKVLAENKTEENIEKGLQDLCDILPSSVKQPCDQFVKEFTPSIIDLLLQELDAQLICSELQICNDTAKSHAPVEQGAVKDSMKLKAKDDPLGCQICEFVVSSVDTLIAENRSEAAIQKGLDDICNILPTGIRPQCLSFVNEYSVAVVQLLLQELDPKQVCIFIGVCPQNQTVEEMEATESDLLCSLCDLVVSQVERLIGANRSEAAVQGALEQVCSLFPQTISAECKSFVDAYTPAIVNLLVQEINATDVCKKLGLCKSSAKLQEEEEEPKVTEATKVSGPLCTICDLVVGQLDRVLGSNRTEAALESALDQVCTFFPPNVTEKCTELISLYAPAIVNLLVQEMQPHAICKNLGLCTATPRVQVTLPVVEVVDEVGGAENNGDDLECALCKIIVTEINTIIGDNRTEAALIHAVETVCDVVSGDLRLQCRSEVQNYGPAVLDLLKHMDDPDQVCQAIRLCAASAGSNASGQKKKKGVADGELCIICQTLANYAGEALKEEATEKEVEKLLSDICTILPDNLTTPCNSMVQQFTPMILQLLAEKDDPQQICQDLKICPKDDDGAQKSVVGVDACTYGPAYWCANMENARKCGVVEDCVEKYGLQP